MRIEGDIKVVLDIVRRVLGRRTDWVNQGQDLMAEIRDEVERTPESLERRATE